MATNGRRFIVPLNGHSTFEAGEVASDAPELAQAVEIIAPYRRAAPLILSSPHSGRIYPKQFLAASRLSPLALRRSEDVYVDRLFSIGLALGAPMLRAHFPRAYLDVNREPYELDPRMFDGALPPEANTRSLRVAAGLGVIPRVVADSQEIYSARLPIAQALNRIDSLYRPYHSALRRLMHCAKSQFGYVVLLDCHSMPSKHQIAGKWETMNADIVLGDRFGASCASALTDAAEQALRAHGLKIMRNKPYAGGFITEHYGAPAAGFHALQIEVNRALYIDENDLSPKKGFESLKAALDGCMSAVIEASLRLAPCPPTVK